MTRNPPRSGVPPQSSAAERAVLGAALLSPRSLDAAVEAGLVAEDFAEPAHAELYGAILHLAEAGKGIDLVTVSTHLESRGLLDEVGGVPFLSGLAGACPSLANVGEYVETVLDRSVRRRLLLAGAATAEDIRDGEISSEAALDAAEARLAALRERAGSDGNCESYGALAVQVYEGAVDAARNPQPANGFSSGWREYDDAIGRLCPGHFDILAARPGMGKSSAARNIAAHVGMRLRRNVVIFSLEMTRREQAAAIMCSEARVQAARLRDNRLARDDWGPLQIQQSAGADARIWIDDRESATLSYIRSVCRRLVRQIGSLDLVIIDYIQLMRGTSEDRRQGRQIEITGISQGLKALAKELGACVLGLAQLNRECERRTDKRPMMSDLRDSGSLEQDADSVSFLYRDEVYHPDSDDNRGKAELLVRKARHGSPGVIHLLWQGGFTRFDVLEPDGGAGWATE